MFFPVWHRTAKVWHRGIDPFSPPLFANCIPDVSLLFICRGPSALVSSPQAGIQEGEQKTQRTIKEIESNGLTVDAEPAEQKEQEKA